MVTVPLLVGGRDPNCSDPAPPASRATFVFHFYKLGAHTWVALGVGRRTCHNVG